MGLLNTLRGGIQESVNRITKPLNDLRNDPVNVVEGITRNDFPLGAELVEFEDGVERVNERVLLIGDSMPLQPFTYGGEQKIVKDYYPGNTEPSVQVLGPRESNIILRGVLKARKIQNVYPENDAGFVGPPEQPTRKEQFRQYPKEMQELIEAMRIRGNVIRFTMGDIQRFGFIERTNFNLKTLAEIEYEIDMSIIGFNPPSDCKVLGRARTVPFDINKQVVRAREEFELNGGNKPDPLPRSLSEIINDEISNVAEITSAATQFVNNVLTEVDSLKDSAARAIGLIKNARAAISNFERRVGAFDPEGGFDKFAGNGITGAYQNANYFSDILNSAFVLAGFLASLQAAIEKLRETEPLARHRVQVGDTLQRLAGRFYNDPSQWEEIYDHNRLQSSNLETIIGTVIEIPNVT